MGCLCGRSACVICTVLWDGSEMWDVRVGRVPVPYKGDYVGLAQNPKWQKTFKSSEDSSVVFADNIMKINRADGKVSFYCCSCG